MGADCAVAPVPIRCRRSDERLEALGVAQWNTVAAIHPRQRLLWPYSSGGSSTLAPF
ncbi:hypothetical protein [Halostagnicola bangensis]